METLYITQASQGAIGDLLIGVMDVGTTQGEPGARLLVRANGQSDNHVLRVGESMDAFGLGRLTLAEVRPGESVTSRGAVTVTWEPSADNVPDGTALDGTAN